MRLVGFLNLITYFFKLIRRSLEGENQEIKVLIIIVILGFITGYLIKHLKK